MVLKTIEIDYQTVDSNLYIMNDEIEGTVDDRIEYCATYSLLVINDEIVGCCSVTLMNEPHFNEIIKGSKMIFEREPIR